MKLIFDKSIEDKKLSILPKSDVPRAEYGDDLTRKAPLKLPALSETDISRHYTLLAARTFGVNDGFYPLGSCTMKYNPKVNEEAAALPGFARAHPLQPVRTAQGCLEAIHLSEKLLCEITGMDNMTFQPAAGAHGELTGLLLIKAYHASRGDTKRVKVIVPDSAHGTNPASAAMAGYQVVSIPSGADGKVDLAALRGAVDETTAGLMLTNPNTLGLFEKDILEITGIVHGAGGLCYYDGANLNAIVGVARPGDMGFDVTHLNLHKTFSTPHGGGGPGSGPVGVKALLAPFLPGPQVRAVESGFEFFTPEMSIGRVKAFYGNFLVTMKALTYILTLGADGLREAAHGAVLNANYLMARLKESFPVAADGLCMHEFVLSLKGLKEETGVLAIDIAKGMIDYGMHPPTMYFPLIVPEALMFEPTETESMETLDQAVEVLRKLNARAYSEPEELKHAPKHAVIGRPDEVSAARKPVVRAAL